MDVRAGSCELASFRVTRPPWIGARAHLVARLCSMSQSDETSSLAGDEQGSSRRGRSSSSDSDKLTSPPRVPKAGLCETCAHRRLVPNTRGSVFLLCMLSRTDPGYPRYPRLPVMSCAGYERLGD